MKTPFYTTLEGRSPGFWVLMGILLAIIAAGLGSAYYMEHHGHVVTGMSNQVVWGTPHVFAVFLIVAASGALNVASISSVFGRSFYKPLSRLSIVLSFAVLLGGLTILVLDLGRPDRLLVALTYYNFKSIFAWNMILYNGFIAITVIYLWFLMERKMARFSKIAGYAGFIWRLVLTTGTGSIFGFLVAREAYDAAILAPMFIVMSFAYGLSIFNLVLLSAYSWSNRPLGDAVVNRVKNLLGVFVAGMLYFVLVYHLTNLYATEHHSFEAFLLIGDNVYNTLFWYGQILIGGVLPLLLAYLPMFKNSRGALALASVLVILGGLAQMYVTIIGGQAYPMDMFPGKEVESSFFDGVVAQYSPSLPEVLLGIGGIGIALFVTVFAIRVLRILPDNLADERIDPHYQAKQESTGEQKSDASGAEATA